MSKSEFESLSYVDAGVDVEAAELTVKGQGIMLYGVGFRFGGLRFRAQGLGRAWAAARH